MYDLVVKNGKTVAGKTISVAITDGKLVEIAPVIEAEAREVLDLGEGSYLSAGWIDSHVHCYEKMALYYDSPDEIGVKKGVTTVIDAGTTGAENVGDFYQLARLAKTNVYALLNISKWGIVEQDELADMTKISPSLIHEALLQYPNFIVGLKARMSKTVIGNNGIKPLILAKEIQAENGHLPLMVHIGSAPPTLSEILDRLTKGDIVTHCFNGKPNGILTDQDQIKEVVWEAYHRGVIFDLGHGTDSFNFHVAKVAKEQHLCCQSMSTDIYHRNRENGPVYDMATTIEKMMAVGYTLEEILPKLTIEPAKNFHLSNKGRLEVGFDADLTIFKEVAENKLLTDSNQQTCEVQGKLVPTHTIIGGTVYDINNL